MTLVHAYAQVIREVPEEKASAFVPRLLAFMKHRGHLSLLPQVLRILEREPARSSIPTVVVARESDARKFSSGIREALTKLGLPREAGAEEKAHRTLIDPRLVGGYSVRANSRIIDRSFRSALVSLYERAIRN